MIQKRKWGARSDAGLEGAVREGNGKRTALQKGKSGRQIKGSKPLNRREKAKKKKRKKVSSAPRMSQKGTMGEKRNLVVHLQDKPEKDEAGKISWEPKGGFSAD